MTASPNAPVRVLVVDDSPLVREGIRTVLEGYGRESSLVVVGEAATVAEAIDQARKCKPDLVLLDIRLPDGSGLEACRALQESAPLIRILVLTSFIDDEIVHEAIALGVAGYVTKDVDPHGLITAIRDVMAGKSVLAPNVCDRVVHIVRSRGRAPEAEARLATLAPQERRVAALVAEGLTNKEIAARLALSENTVKNYLVGVYGKLGVKRRSEAAVCFSNASRSPDRFK